MSIAGWLFILDWQLNSRVPHGSVKKLSRRFWFHDRQMAIRNITSFKEWRADDTTTCHTLFLARPCSRSVDRSFDFSNYKKWKKVLNCSIQISRFPLDNCDAISVKVTNNNQSGWHSSKMWKLLVWIRRVPCVGVSFLRLVGLPQFNYGFQGNKNRLKGLWYLSLVGKETHVGPTSQLRSPKKKLLAIIISIFPLTTPWNDFFHLADCYPVLIDLL